jgi:RNA polymerase sigma factor (sigma-70 family)
MTTIMTFEAIYKKYNRQVLKFLKNRLKDEMVAEELSADVMIRVHKNLHLYNEQLSQLNTWIMNIAKNIMIDFLRKRTLSVVSLETVYGELAQNGDDESAMDRFKPLSDSNNNPEDELISKEVSQTMFSKYEKLSETEQTIAALHFFDGLSYDEVAEQLRMPLGTVKAKLHHARIALMEAFPVEMRK